MLHKAGEHFDELYQAAHLLHPAPHRIGELQTLLAELYEPKEPRT